MTTSRQLRWVRCIGSMNGMTVLAAACAIIVLTAPVSHARSLEAAEKEALAATVADFNAAMSSFSLEKIIAVIPPRIIQRIAAKAGLEVEALRAAIVSQMQDTFKQVKLSSFGMDLTKTEYKELANGTPYALIPTTTVIEIGNGLRLSNSSHSLAILDEGKWYLLRIEDAGQVLIFRELYPDYAGIEFPSGSTKVIEPEANK